MIYNRTNANLDDLDATVRRTTKALRPVLDRFDSIAVAGMSGVLVGAPVSLRLKKPLVIVRKDGDGSHHGSHKIVNVDNVGQRVLFLDDFVSSGNTKKRVQSKIEALKGDPRVVGQFEYGWSLRFYEDDRRIPVGAEAAAT